MALFGKRPELQSSSPHPIGVVPDEIHEALSSLDARRRQQRIEELRCAHAPIPEADSDVRIIAMRPEATMFLNLTSPKPRPMIAWRWRWPSGHVSVLFESEFRAHPSEWATPRDDGVELATGDDLE